MTKRFSLYTILFGLIFFFASCAKDPVGPDDPNDPAPTPVNTTEFRWTKNNSTTTATTADSAVYYPQFTTIYGYKNGTMNTVEINLSDLVVGTYSISSVTGNQLIYVENGNTFNAKSGTVKITTNSANLITGDFSCAFTGTVVTNLSGTFKDLKHR